MRLAIFADIHANLPALEAALREVERAGVDRILVAGDMLTGPNPVEVLRCLRQLDCWMIRGNQEGYMLRFFSGEAQPWCYTSQQWAFVHWNYRQLERESLEFLASLPEQACFELPGTDPIRVVHGSPRNISELIYPEQDISALDTALGMVPEPVLILGHTHLAWQMRRNGRLALNPGALGGTFTGKPGGGYAILEWQAGGWQAQLRELRYDVSLVSQSFRESGLLAEGGAFARHWLRSLETGVNTLPGFVEFAFEMAKEAGYPDSPYVPDDIWEQADRLFRHAAAPDQPTVSSKGKP